MPRLGTNDGLGGMLFCRPDFIDTAKLYQILRDVIKLAPEDFEGVYSHFRRSFEQSGDNDYVLRSVSLVRRRLRPLPATCPGIDLPSWIKAPNSDQTLVLLGQDPLRDDESQHRVVIGTPYSFHSARRRGSYPSRSYWEAIHHLHRAGFNLYLTDVRKFWSKETNGAKSRAENTPAADQINKAILQKELDLIAPRGDPSVIVVALGGDASLALNTPFLGSKSKAKIEKRDGRLILSVMHLSNIAQHPRATYLKRHGLNPTWGALGIAKVIVQAINRFRAPRKTDRPGVSTTPSPARPADNIAALLGTPINERS